jgi:hypothetical protein
MTMFRREDSGEKFRETLFTRWTEGLSPVEQRISIFSHIRDIPYAIIPGWLGEDDLIRMMVTENRGWCGPKHQLLAWMFERVGITIRFIQIPFRWQDQKVKYPDQLKDLLPFLPSTTHLCCTALLDKSWRLLDATWDPPLRKAGFPINNPWDGISGTIPAVIRFDPGAPEPITLPRNTRPGSRTGFVDLLNTWLEEVRMER